MVMAGGQAIVGQIGAKFSAVATFIGSIRQTNNVGAAFSATATATADIVSSVTKQVGAAFSATATFAGSIVQTNRVGAALSATASMTADIQQGTPSIQPLAMDMGNFSNTYILQL